MEIVLAVLCGLVLLGDQVPGGSSIGALIGKLRPFGTVLGVVALVVGLLGLFSPLGVLLLLGGWALAADALGGVPAVGGRLKRWGRRLRQVGWLLGALLIGVAFLELIGWLGRPGGVGPPPWRP